MKRASAKSVKNVSKDVMLNPPRTLERGAKFGIEDTPGNPILKQLDLLSQV